LRKKEEFSGKLWHGVCNKEGMKSEKLLFRSSPVSFTPKILESQVSFGGNGRGRTALLMDIANINPL